MCVVDLDFKKEEPLALGRVELLRRGTSLDRVDEMKAEAVVIVSSRNSLGTTQSTATRDAAKMARYQGRGS